MAGPEVLSRRIMIFDKSANDFLPGAVAAFDAKTGASSLPCKAHVPRPVNSSPARQQNHSKLKFNHTHRDYNHGLALSQYSSENNGVHACHEI